MGDIFAFYSFKGGTGRSMALANISILLAQWGYNVLIVDWDLEAPGIESYFKDLISDYTNVTQKQGVLDLLTSYKDSFSGRKKVLDWKDLIVEIHPISVHKNISLITSGKRPGNYLRNLRKLNLQAFYQENEGGQFIEHLRDEWKQNYDFVLIDSRTGYTDIGGICTVQLPDFLLLFFTTSYQSLNGILDVSRRSFNAQQKLFADRLGMVFIPILSRFDSQAEYTITQNWLNVFSEKLNDLYYEWLPESDKHSRQILEITKLPYIPYFSFGEKLPVIEHGTDDPLGLGYYYENVSALIVNKLEDAKLLIEDRDQYIRKAVKDSPKITKDPNKSLKNSTFDDFIKSDEMKLLKDESLYEIACEAVDQFLKDKKPVKNAQLFGITAIMNARGFTGLKDLIENQKTKNTKKENKAFWEFIWEIIIEYPGSQISLRFFLQNQQQIKALLKDEISLTGKKERRQARKANKAVIDKIIGHVLPIYFEHFNCHYFYRTRQGA